MISIQNVSRLYSNLSQSSIVRHHINSEDLSRLSGLLQQMIKQLGENNSDRSWWDQFLGPIYRYREDHVLSPIPLNNLGRINNSIISSMQIFVENLPHTYPDLFESARLLLETFETCIASEDNPVSDTISSIISDMDEIQHFAVLTKDRKSRDLTTQFYESAQSETTGIPIIYPQNLKDTAESTFSMLIVIGPAYTFPEFVFTAPSAPIIHTLSLSFINDTWEPSELFENSLGTQFKPQFTNIKLSIPSLNPIVNTIDISEATDLSYKIATLPRLSSQNYQENNRSYDPSEIIEALDFILESGDHIYFDKSSKKYVLDPEQDMTENIKHIDVDIIEPGMFVLVRRGGGGDLVGLVADNLMDESGQDAQSKRNSQKKWKYKLLNKCISLGNDKQQVSAELIQLGLNIADPQNINNWISPDSIALQSPEYFAILMEYIGLGAESDNILEDMRIIRSFHQSAGSRISIALKDQVSQISYEQLIQEQQHEISLPGHPDQSLLAIRIDSKNPITHQILKSEVDILRPYEYV